MSASQLETVSAACRVLLKYLISALQTAATELNPNCAQIERYLNAIKVLCSGTGLLATAEVSVLVETMKGENLPQQSPSPGESTNFPSNLTSLSSNPD